MDGVECQGIQLALGGTLPVEAGLPVTGNTKITFYVDGQGNLRRWKMESDLEQDGEKLNTVADARFSGFDEPWMVTLPEWAAGGK